MAEMAALLVLRKKWEAFCSEVAEGCPVLPHARSRSSSSVRRMLLVKACSEIGICLRTLKRWRKALIGDGIGERRKGSQRLVLHKLSEEELQSILLICN